MSVFLVQGGESSFLKIKRSLYIYCYSLLHPDPSCQVVLKVDASVVEVIAVLSQWDASNRKSQSWAFFSRRLSPAEANYKVGNRELLLVVHALQE